jgi:hypothetical protein
MSKPENITEGTMAPGTGRALRQFGIAVAEASDGQCGCGGAWTEILRQWPAPLHSGEELERWAEVVHDLVNVKLGKKRFHSYPHAAFAVEGTAAAKFKAKRDEARRLQLARARLRDAQKGDKPKQPNQED